VEIEECGDVTQAWEGGLGGGAVVLLLSPDAVPASSGRGAWQELLRHWESNAAPAVATVVVNPCAYPRLLDRRNSFPWSEVALRQLERWVMDLEPPLPSWQPAALAWFTGREQELEQLWTRLVDVPGTCILAGNGKTALAQEFARQARHNFRELLRVDGEGRSAASIEFLCRPSGWIGFPSPPGNTSASCGRIPHGAVPRCVASSLIKATLPVGATT